MTTPTREQIEAEFASFIEYPSEDKRYVTTTSCLMFAEHIARIAHTAGRDQGLREAKEVCEAMHDEDRPGDYVYAIEQLRGK